MSKKVTSTSMWAYCPWTERWPEQGIRCGPLEKLRPTEATSKEEQLATGRQPGRFQENSDDKTWPKIWRSKVATFDLQIFGHVLSSEFSWNLPGCLPVASCSSLDVASVGLSFSRGPHRMPCSGQRSVHGQYAHIEVLVTFLLINFFGFLVITRDHGGFGGCH